MRRSTPQHALLALVLRRSLSPAGHIIRCPHPDCGAYYDPSSPAESYEHNNH